MEEKKLSKETEDFLEMLVERAARKAGYLDSMVGSYGDYLENTIALKSDYLKKKFQNKGNKIHLKPRLMPFAEEIKLYFHQNIQILIDKGNAEDAALKIMTARVEQAEKKPDFESFALMLDGFWIQEYSEWQNMQAQRDELEGLFYIAFLILGVTVGGFLGYALSYTLRGSLIGLAVGFGLGLSCGIFTHILMRWRRR